MVFAFTSKSTSLVSKSITIAAFFANKSDPINIKVINKGTTKYLTKSCYKAHYHNAFDINKSKKTSLNSLKSAYLLNYEIN